MCVCVGGGAYIGVRAWVCVCEYAHWCVHALGQMFISTCVCECVCVCVCVCVCNVCVCVSVCVCVCVCVCV